MTGSDVHDDRGVRGVRRGAWWGRSTWPGTSATCTVVRPLILVSVVRARARGRGAVSCSGTTSGAHRRTPRDRPRRRAADGHGDRHLGELRVSGRPGPRRRPRERGSSPRRQPRRTVPRCPRGWCAGGVRRQPLMVPYVVFVWPSPWRSSWCWPRRRPSTGRRRRSPTAAAAAGTRGQGRRVLGCRHRRVFAALAVQGLFTSVRADVPRTTFHVTDRLAAGATTFGVFAASAVSQIVFARCHSARRSGWAWCCSSWARRLGAAAVVLQVAGFIGGGVVAGAGSACCSVPRSAAPARSWSRPVAGVSSPHVPHRLRGLTVPVVAVGAALLVLPTLPVLLGYVVLVIVLAVVAGSRLAAPPDGRARGAGRGHGPGGKTPVRHTGRVSRSATVPSSAGSQPPGGRHRRRRGRPHCTTRCRTTR